MGSTRRGKTDSALIVAAFPISVFLPQRREDAQVVLAVRCVVLSGGGGGGGQRTKSPRWCVKERQGADGKSEGKAKARRVWQ